VAGKALLCADIARFGGAFSAASRAMCEGEVGRAAVGVQMLAKWQIV